MGKINVARVILGGLLAGLIINISEYVLNMYVIADESSALLQRLGLPEIGTHQIGVFVAMTFVLGIVIVFLYAGLRPRFGAGVKNAIIAGLIVWIVAIMVSASDVVIGLVPADLFHVAAPWSLVETLVAAVAGAWVYKESA